MQKWEYKYIIQYRGYQARGKDEFFHWAGDWDTWYEDGNKLPTPVNITKKLGELGEAGWELVAVVPRSGLVGGVSTIYGFTANLVGGGKTEGSSTDFAGFTSEQLWVFKRAK